MGIDVYMMTPLAAVTNSRHSLLHAWPMDVQGFADCYDTIYLGSTGFICYLHPARFRRGSHLTPVPV